MYGPATPTPTRALLARIAFASFPLWSLGLLSWVPSLRFAVLRRRPYDWAVFALACVLTVVYIVLLVKVPETKPGEEGNAQLAAGIYMRGSGRPGRGRSRSVPGCRRPRRGSGRARTPRRPGRGRVR